MVAWQFKLRQLNFFVIFKVSYLNKLIEIEKKNKKILMRNRVKFELSEFEMSCTWYKYRTSYLLSEFRCRSLLNTANLLWTGIFWWWCLGRSCRLKPRSNVASSDLWCCFFPHQVDPLRCKQFHWIFEGFWNKHEQ